MDLTRFASRFPLGSHLCREPMPAMSEMKRDMETLKRKGFNMIKLQEHWAVDEAVEGRIDLARYEELIAHAATLDLGVYLGFTMEHAPAWLYRKHPECRMVGRDGRTIVYEAPSTLPTDGKPGPCYDHPAALAEHLRFLTQAVGILARHENIVVWNTWQEIDYWAEGMVGIDTCFCPHTQAAFHAWLQGRYGDLDSLNRAWQHARYTNWAEVMPARSQGGGRTPCMVEIAWKEFMEGEQIARVLRARCAAIKAADPHGRPVFAHRAGPTVGGGRDWDRSSAQDFYGTSVYPAWSPFINGRDDGSNPGGRVERTVALRAEVANYILPNLDYVRSASPGGRFWCAEFQGGPISTGLHRGRVPSADDIRRWMLAAVAGGTSGISFWVTRAEIAAGEINGFSLLDPTGDSSARLDEAGRVGSALDRHADLFAKPTLAPSPVAILVDERNHQLCGMLSQGDLQSYSVRGWHRLLTDLGIACDFIEARHLQPTTLARYTAVVAPLPLMMDEALIALLEGYVNTGGQLVCEVMAGRLDGNAFCLRGSMQPRLAALLGVRADEPRTVCEPGNATRWTPGERSWGEFAEAGWITGEGALIGARLQAHGFIQTVEPAGADVVGRFAGQVVATRHPSGSGQAWFIGSLIGPGGTAYRDPAHHQAVNMLLNACGAQPCHAGRLVCRKRILPDQEAWIFINQHDEEMSEVVATEGFSRIEDLLGAPLELDPGGVRLTVAPLDVRVLILKR